MFGSYLAPEGGLHGVGYGRRVGAYLIDLVLHYITSIIAGFFIGIILAFIAAATHQPFEVLMLRFSTGPQWQTFILAMVGMLSYRCIMEGFCGSTLGKRLLDMAVVQEDGTPCRFGSAIIRGLAFYVDALFFGLIGYLNMQKSDMQQRHGDDWAHTVVCRRGEINPENLRGGGAFAGALLMGIAADGIFMLLGFTLRMT